MLMFPFSFSGTVSRRCTNAGYTEHSVCSTKDNLTISLQTETSYIQHPTHLLWALKHWENLYPKKRRKVILYQWISNTKKSGCKHITTQETSVKKIRTICLKTHEWDSLNLAIYQVTNVNFHQNSLISNGERQTLSQYISSYFNINVYSRWNE